MSATAAIEIGSDLWNARVYAGLSVASELAAGLEQSKRVGSSLGKIWTTYRALGRFNRLLDELFSTVDQAAERNQMPILVVSANGDNSVARDNIRQLLVLHALGTSLLSLREDISWSRLLRKKLEKLQAHTERLLDLADWCDAMCTPDEMKAKFDAALADLERGDVVPWAAVQ